MEATGAAPVLIVDGANVMGSRPDGWWRDRRAGAARLVGQLADALRCGALDGPVTVVLEGAARSAAPADASGPLRVLNAPGSGDDRIVEEVAGEVGRGSRVVVATADRELRRRVEALGASVVSPRTVLDRLAPGSR